MGAFLLSASVERLGWTLLHSLWQLAVLGCGAMLLHAAMRRSSASARYAACLAVLAWMAAAPIVTWGLLSQNRSTVADREAVGHVPGAAQIVAPSSMGTERLKNGTAPVAIVSRASNGVGADTVPSRPRGVLETLTAWRLSAEVHLRPWLAQIVSVWALGVLAFTVRPLMSWRAVRRLRTLDRVAAPAAVQNLIERIAPRLGLRRAVQIVQSTLVSSPVVVGFFRPLILLPASVLTGLPADQLEAILAHELAHVRRHDYLVNLLQTLIETVLFYHPAVWWLSGQIRRERENCCDDLALVAVGNRAGYGRALLALEELRGPATVWALGAEGGSLLARIQRMAEGSGSGRRAGDVGSIGALARLTTVGVLAGCIAASQFLFPVGPSGVADAGQENDARNDLQKQTFAGQVVNETGQGVGGVKVTLLIPGERKGPECTTDSDGKFSGEILAKASDRVFLRAEHPDYVRAHATTSGDKKEPVTIRLNPGIVVGGLVRGEEGEPIENVQIKLDHVRATTDANGRWQARVPAEYRPSSLLVYHTEYVCVTLSGAPSQEQLRAKTILTVLQRGHGLQGVVRDTEGRPVAGALVLTQPYNVDMDAPDEDPTTARTDRDGAFKVRNTRSGAGALAIYADSHAPRVVPVNVTSDTPPVAIQLAPAGRLDGQLVDQVGAPIAEAWVSAVDWGVSDSFPLIRKARTDAKGMFQLADLPTESGFGIQCDHADYMSRTFDDVRARAKPYRLTMYRPTEIRGRVLDDETGKPIRRFRVIQGRRGSEGEEIVYRRHTLDTEEVDSPEGDFLSKLQYAMVSPPFPEFAVRIEANGYLPAETTAVSLGKKAEPVTLRLRRGRPIVGSVVDSQGQPADKAQVAWVGPRRIAQIHGGNFQRADWAEVIVETDSQGRFELPASEDRGLIVALAAGGYASRASHEHKPGSEIRLIPWARVEGRVLAGRDPLPNVDVSLKTPGPPSPSHEPSIVWSFYQRTAADGEFAFDHVPSIPLTAAWQRALLDSHTTPLTPEPGRTTSVTVGGEGGAVIGSIEKPEGLNLEQFSSEFRAGLHCTQVVAYPVEQSAQKKESRSSYLARLGDDGGFSIHGLPPGQYELEVNVHAPTPPQSCGLPVSVAIARARFEIVEAQFEKPVSLGALMLTRVPGPQAGQPAPALRGKTLTGEPFDLESLRGKLVLLDFWANWCAPCKAATPRLKQLQDKYGDQLAIVGVNLDQPGIMSGYARAYVEQQEITWPQFAAGGWGEDNPVLSAFAVTAVPSFWLVDPKGVILGRDIPLDDLQTAIDAAVRGQ